MAMAGDEMGSQERLNENISALADGELATGEIELAFAALGTEQGHAAWDVYHRIGHALRSESCGAELSGDFYTRLAKRLASEHAPGPGSGGHQPAASAGNEAAPSDTATSLP